MKALSKHSWQIMLFSGLLILAQAYYNIIFVPGIAADDPQWGWQWLTTDAEVVEYIKFQFHFLGLWTLLSGIMVTVIAATGYRLKQRWAWYSLAYLPLHLLLFIGLTPWTLPIAGSVFVLVLVGLFAPFREFFPRPE